MEGEEHIKISKKNLYFIFVIVLCLLILVYYFLFFAPANKEREETEGYRKSLYDSVLCQYSCPLEEQTVGNSTGILPDKTCVRECVENTEKTRSVDLNQFNVRELIGDEFIQEIEDIAVRCRTDTLDENGEIDNEGFFNCVRAGLEGMKENYTYLN